MSDQGDRQAPERLSAGDSPQGALLAAAERATEPPPGAHDRVWRSVQGAQGRAAPKLGWAAGLTFATASLAALFFWLRPLPAPRAQPVGSLAEASGAVALESADGSVIAGAPGAELHGQNLVRVGEQGDALLQLGSARALLSANSRARLGPGGELTVEVGEAAVATPSASITVVAAGSYVVEAGSAVFLVRVQARRTEVLVRQGSVRIRGEAEIFQGGSWSSGGKAESISDDERKRANRVAGYALPDVDPRPPPPVVHNEPPPKPAPPPPRVVVRAPKAPPLPPAPAPAAIESQKESDDSLAARAHLLERDGQREQAAAVYAELSQRNGARAEAALYELARLWQRFLGQPAAALQALDEYERRFPDGALAREAALTAIEARLSLGGGEPALRAMDAFLARFGDSERAPDVRWLRASLLVDRGECAQAAPDLESLAVAGPHAGDALFALASCSRKAGALDQARARLEEYLRRFPQGPHRARVHAALGEGKP